MNKMSSADDKVATLPNEENVDKIPEPSALQNFADGEKLKMELEWNERKIAQYTVGIQNIEQHLSHIENATRPLEKTLVDTQTEISQMDQEITTTKATIDEICSREK